MTPETFKESGQWELKILLPQTPPHEGIVHQGLQARAAGRISGASDWSTDGNNNSSAPKLDVLEVISVDENFQTELKKKPQKEQSRDSPCPPNECQDLGRKLKFNVQQMHLPRLLWDNPQPPLKEECLSRRDGLRQDLLLLMAEFLTGKRDRLGEHQYKTPNSVKK